MNTLALKIQQSFQTYAKLPALELDEITLTYEELAKQASFLAKKLNNWGGGRIALFLVIVALEFMLLF